MLPKTVLHFVSFVSFCSNSVVFRHLTGIESKDTP